MRQLKGFTLQTNRTIQLQNFAVQNSNFMRIQFHVFKNMEITNQTVDLTQT